MQIARYIANNSASSKAVIAQLALSTYGINAAATKRKNSPTTLTKLHWHRTDQMRINAQHFAPKAKHFSHAIWPPMEPLRPARAKPNAHHFGQCKCHASSPRSTCRSAKLNLNHTGDGSLINGCRCSTAAVPSYLGHSSYLCVWDGHMACGCRTALFAVPAHNTRSPHSGARYLAGYEVCPTHGLRPFDVDLSGPATPSPSFYGSRRLRRVARRDGVAAPCGRGKENCPPLPPSGASPLSFTRRRSVQAEAHATATPNAFRYRTQLAQTTRTQNPL